MNHAYYYETPIGKIGLVENGAAIIRLCFGTIIPQNIKLMETSILEEANLQLQEYLCGNRKSFDLLLSPQGTEFQKKVWKTLQEIPYGKTCSYKDIAKQIGNPKAYRAVGMVNNKNPLPIFIPCHRVVGVDGSLIGYINGIELKKELLELEKKYAAC
ncbi:MAG: ogt [Pelosinus sp.]|nr:ogt [Pelosinus sp.]